MTDCYEPLTFLWRWTA